MFKKILFATSGSPACDDAARTAFELAKRYGSELITLHVVGVPTRGFSHVVEDVRTGETVEMDENYLDLVKEELANTYAKPTERCGSCRYEVVSGVPHREILRKAREEDVDLVVMGASTKSEHDHPTYRRGIPGSTLQRVAKAARCPVLSVSRPSASYWGGISNIVFATDFSKAAESAFKFALKLAKDTGSHLHLFHALDISANQAGKMLMQEELEDALMAARKKMNAKYASQINGFKNYEAEVWEGVPYVEIVKYAREKQADLIVLAHHTSELDADKAHLGSTLEQVIMRATCPVASVNRPDKI